MKGSNLLLVVAIGLGIAVSGCDSGSSGGGKGKPGVPGKPVAPQCPTFKASTQARELGSGAFSGLWQGTGVLEDGMKSENCSRVNFEIYQDATTLRVNVAQLDCDTRCLPWGKSEFQVRGNSVYLQNKLVGEIYGTGSANIEFNVGQSTKYNLILQRNGQNLEIRDLRSYWVNHHNAFFGTTSNLRKVQ